MCVAIIMDTVTIMSHHHVYIPSMCVVRCLSEGTDVGGGDVIGTLGAVGCCISAVQYNTSDCTCLCLKNTKAQTLSCRKKL